MCAYGENGEKFLYIIRCSLALEELMSIDTIVYDMNSELIFIMQVELRQENNLQCAYVHDGYRPWEMSKLLQDIMHDGFCVSDGMYGEIHCNWCMENVVSQGTKIWKDNEGISEYLSLSIASF